MSDDEYQIPDVEQQEPVFEDVGQNEDEPPPDGLDIDREQFDYLKRSSNQLKDNSEDVNIMVIDLDFEIGRNNRPNIRIFGNTERGQSVCCIVQGFKPYFFLPSLPKLSPSENNAAHIVNELNNKGKQSNEIRTGQGIEKVQFVYKKNIRVYSKPDQNQSRDPNFLKIYTQNPPLVNKFRSVFEKGFTIEGDMFSNTTFESNIPYVLRFLVDKQITGMGWVQIPSNQYSLISHDKKRSVCQHEILCHQSSVKALSGETRWDKLSPLRILSFDIQCVAERGFPDEKVHPISDIGIACRTTGEDSIQKIVITLNDSLPIPGVNVICQKQQKNVLRRFEQIIRAYDPDFIIGYNMVNFDFKYIMGRAQALGMKSYGYFGRLKYSKSSIKKERYLSKAMGMRETHEIGIIGRIKLDMLIHMHGQHQLSSYTLNSVSAIFLNEEKEDVHHSQIYGLFKGTKESRKRLAEYCLKDAILPLKLMQKLMCLYNYTQMSRVTGVPINFLFKRGQQIKVISQILRKIKNLDLVIPTEMSRGKTGDIGFQGAYVLNPKQGFYKQPVATLDFASLYPSIMMAHNLCYTTLISVKDINRLGYTEGKEYERTPTGVFFVKSEIKKGILPQILSDLISARKRAKQALAQTTDEQLKAVLDGRQLALKISANSVYGFTGATVGQLPCLQISASVTSIGRNLIDFTSKKVVQLFPGSEVLYGDTDSVMVKFPISEQEGCQRQQLMRAEAMDYGRKAASQISALIGRPPIKLQFEKVYSPFLLMAKKRYSGLLFTQPQKPDKLDKKGFESVRRDNCHLIRSMLEIVLKKLFDGDDIKQSINYIKGKVSNLLMNKIDLSQLIITKSINRKLGEQQYDPKKKQKGNKYKVKQAHVELAQRMMKRNPEVVIEIGDRIPYIIVKGTKGTKNYENAEDPQRVQEEDLPIDFDYYIQKQIRPPLERLLVDTGIISNIDPLFNGQHTNNRYVPRLIAGGLSGFMKQIGKCIGCRTPSQKPLCKNCQVNHIDIYLQQYELLQKNQKIFNKLWTHCQQCQGSVLGNNFCRNTDCKIYYRRTKVKKQVTQKSEQLKKLESQFENDACLSW